MGKKTVLETESFAFFDNSCFMTTEYCKAHIIALALPIRVSSFSSCFPSLVNTTSRYLNFSTYFSNASLICNEHWSRLLKNWNTSVLASQWYYMQLQSQLMHVGDKIQWKKAKPDHLRTTNDWSCSFQSWHTHWFDCVCLSSSYGDKERRQNASLTETNAHMEWRSLLTTDKKSDFRLVVEIRMASNSWPSMPYSCKTF